MLQKVLAQSATGKAYARGYARGPTRGCVDLCTCRLFAQRQYQTMHENEADFQCHVGHFDWVFFLVSSEF